MPEFDPQPISHLAQASARKITDESDCDLNSQQPKLNMMTQLADAECYATECREHDMGKMIEGGDGGNAEEACHGRGKGAQPDY